MHQATVNRPARADVTSLNRLFRHRSQPTRTRGSHGQSATPRGRFRSLRSYRVRPPRPDSRRPTAPSRRDSQLASTGADRPRQLSPPDCSSVARRPVCRCCRHEYVLRSVVLLGGLSRAVHRTGSPSGRAAFDRSRMWPWLPSPSDRVSGHVTRHRVLAVACCLGFHISPERRFVVEWEQRNAVAPTPSRPRWDVQPVAVLASRWHRGGARHLPSRPREERRTSVGARTARGKLLEDRGRANRLSCGSTTALRQWHLGSFVVLLVMADGWHDCARQRWASGTMAATGLL